MIWYDLEIVKMIPTKGQDNNPELSYCKGWGDHSNMGISVLVAFSEERKTVGVFMNDNRAEFQEWIDETNFIMGFNNHRFDDKVVLTNWHVNIPQEKSIDLYPIIRDQAPKGIRGSLSLGALCEANFNIGKLGDGAQYPALWQKGHRGEVINDCINDVRMLKLLYSKIKKVGKIIDPRTGNEMVIKMGNG